MLGLKSYLKIVVEELNKHDWSWDNKNRYTDFFDKIAPLLDVKSRKDLNYNLKEFQNKWHGLRPIQGEHIIWAMQHHQIGKKLQFKLVIKNPKAYDEIRKIDADWMQMELDLRSIKNWCFSELKRMVINKDINFTKEEVLNVKHDV